MKTKIMNDRKLTDEQIDHKILIFSEAIKALDDEFSEGVPLASPGKGDGFMFGHGVYRDCDTKKLEYGDYELYGSAYFAPIIENPNRSYCERRLNELHEEKRRRQEKMEKLKVIKQEIDYLRELSAQYGEIENYTMSL